jgi:sugar lactone lactonase YvrE
MKIGIRSYVQAAMVAALLFPFGLAFAQATWTDVVPNLPGDRIENVYEARDGALYYTAVFEDRVMRLKPGEKQPTVFFSTHEPQGIVETPSGFVVDYQDRNPDFSSGKFDLRGLGAHLAVLDRAGQRVRTIDGLDDPAFFNGMALSGGTTVFIADSGGDRILEINLKTEKTEVWLDCKKTALASTPGLPNGLKVHDGWVYFSRGDIYRVKIGADGLASGAPELAAKTGGTDDFDVARDGTVYSSHGMDVLKLPPSGPSSKLIDGKCEFCTATRVSPDGRTLYFTGGAVPGIPGMPPIPGFLRKVALE